MTLFERGVFFLSYEECSWYLELLKFNNIMMYSLEKNGYAKGKENCEENKQL